LAFEDFPLEGFADDDGEVVHVDGLGEKIVGAFLHGLHGPVDGPMGGHHDDRQIESLAPVVPSPRQLLEHVQSGEPRHFHVQQHEARRLPLDGFDRVGSVVRKDRLVAGGLQPVLEDRGNVRVVVNHEDFSLHAAPQKREA